ncbi:MAG TPA: TorF family putative porin [Caldimonas sp.]|nr:TorF family putative porin [Caldimonas sp.]
MKKTILSLAVVSALSAAAVVHAEDAPAPAPAPAPAASAEAPASPLSFNIGVVSDYRFRGISQTRFDPALQGGIDYAIPNTGFYIGTWMSNIKWIKDAGEIAGVDTGSAPVEWDFYGGYKGEIVKDTLSYDVGLLQYYYPNQHLDRIPNTYSPDTLEIYGALTYGPATVKYSHSLTRLFGTADSKNSGYLEAAATFDVGGGFSVTPHIGYQHVAHNSNLTYTDYSLTGSHDWFGLSFSLAYIGTSTKDINGTPAYLSPDNKNLGRSSLVFGVKKTF